MATSRAYKTLNAQNLTQSFYPWGGSDRTFLLIKSDDTVPDSVSSSSYAEVTNAGTNVVTIDKTFICPSVFDVLSVAEGTAYGSVRAAASMTSDRGTSESGELKEVRVDVLAMDSTGATRSLSGGIQTVWSGSVRGGDPAGSDKYLGTMFWLPVSGEIQQSERLGLRVQIYGTATTYGRHRLFFTKNSDETSLTIPLVIE